MVVLLLSLLPVAAVQQSAADVANALMDHLAGRWTMNGTLGGKQTTHDADARWVLNREYVEFHEVSRERRADGTPSYEAILFLGWHPTTSEFMCLFLDNTIGGGLSPEGIARGKRSGNAISVAFACRSGECPPGLSEHESLHTTFDYQPSTDTWRLTIDDVKDGKTDRFGDMTLKRNNK
jgi:hypothetical protein